MTEPESPGRTYSPNVRVRRLARKLREWRSASGLSLEDVATKCGWSRAKQSRLEAPMSPIRPVDVVTLAMVYRIPDDEREAVFDAAQTAQNPGWWANVANGAVAADALDYVQLESEATRVRTFKIDLVPGLMQTADYATAVTRAYGPDIPEETLADRVNARIQRQGRLTDSTPLKVEAILAEAALTINVGSPEVMRDQLHRLLDLSELPNVDLRVLPAASGAHPAMGLPFNILSFSSNDPDVGYLELADKAVYLEESADVEPYNLKFDALHEMAAGNTESREIISALAAEKQR